MTNSAATPSAAAGPSKTAKRPMRGAAWLAAASGLAAALHAGSPPNAAELYNDGNLVLRWDNTLAYSAAFRLERSDPALLANVNADDGDRNFRPGLISNRIDLMSRIDIARNGFGFDVSARAWCDSVYDQRNDNNSPATFNPVSVPHNRFTDETRSLNGHRAEFADAFLYGAGDLGSLPLSFRIGRQTLVWGESLFFPENGIAGAQAPIDEIREEMQSGAYSKDIYLPVGQASGSLGLGSGTTLDAYYQFEWRPNRLPGSGSYFSSSDVLDPGGERYIVGPGEYLYEQPDRPAPGTGQYGVALRFSAGAVDYGLYALRFNAKDPEIYYRIHSASPSWPYGGYPSTDGDDGAFYRLYPRGIALYGASASFSLGDANIAAEISARRNTPLASLGLYDRQGQAGAAGDRPLYAVGDTLNGDASSITSLPRNRLWDNATLSVDVAARWRLGVIQNPAALDPAARNVAVAVRASFEPTWYQALPHLDLTLRAGLGYGLTGRLGTDPYQSQSQGAGDLELGVTATYRVVWSGNVTVTHFIGDARDQPLADRDFLSISVRRTF